MWMTLHEEAGRQWPAGAGRRFSCVLAYYSAPPSGNPLDWFNDPTKPPFPSVLRDLRRSRHGRDVAELLGQAAARQLGARRAELRTRRPADATARRSSSRSSPPTAVDGNPTGCRRLRGQGHCRRAPKPQGLAALELDPYRDVALVYAPGAVGRREQEGDRATARS